jgi:CubicO group peptidase (beta-lactamase class C family)
MYSKVHCLARCCRSTRLAVLHLALTFGAAGSVLVTTACSAEDEPQSPQTAVIESIVESAIPQYHIKGIIVQVRYRGRDLYLKAAGESMTGVPVTTDMHFRNGAMAFTYMSTMLLELVDQGEVALDDKLSKFLPEIPGASAVTLKELANMTSGYQDYVYEPAVLTGTNLNPFRQWTPEELIHIGVTPPRWFYPGTNWAYSHTNYVILGRALEKITRTSLAEAMRRYIFRPMGLRQTRSIDTPEIPDPVMHSFSSERRADLKIPDDVTFYEEATFWNPSWTTAKGAVQITDITDMSKSMEVVGNGTLLSPASYTAQVGPNLVGFGHPQDGCPPCAENTVAHSYGLGVLILGPWIGQTKSFAGSGATVGYLRAAQLTISVVTTYTPEAFDEQGNYPNASVPIFTALANALAPNTLPPEPPD